MAMRLLVVLVLIVLGVVVWMKKEGAEEGEIKLAEVAQTETKDKPAPYFNPNVEGVEPDGAPEFNVVHELRMVGQQTRMFFTVTEAHGWYADHVYVEFWYEEEDENGERRRVGDPVRLMMKGYVDFGKTLEDNTTLLDYEFPELDGFGTTENWQARVNQYGKVLSPLPG